MDVEKKPTSEPKTGRQAWEIPTLEVGRIEDLTEATNITGNDGATSS